MAWTRASTRLLIVLGLAIPLASPAPATETSNSYPVSATIGDWSRSGSTKWDQPTEFVLTESCNAEVISPALATTPLSMDLPATSYVDFDSYVEHGDMPIPCSTCWSWLVLPDGVVYRSYLAGTKEPRLAAHVFSMRNDNTMFDGILGARIALLRYGTADPYMPEGFEVQVEGAGQVRLDIPEDVDVRAVDFRAGVPLAYSVGCHRFKFAYYHLSSHVGDEFMLKNPTFDRLNFARDVLVLGYSYYATPEVRLYAEAGWAFYTDVSEPWEFQFGLDYAPAAPTGIHGAPFFAINGHLREEVNFGGAMTIQAGWSWFSDTGANLLRMGLHYYNGESNQFSFFDRNEEQLGFGIWYDF